MYYFKEFPVAEGSIFVNVNNVTYIRKSWYDKTKTVLHLVGYEKNTVEVMADISDVMKLLKPKE